MTMMFLLIILGATDKRASRSCGSSGRLRIAGAALGAAVYRFIGSAKD